MQTDTNPVVDQQDKTVGAKWDIIRDLIIGLPTKVHQLVEGSTWSITITNGGQGYVDSKHFQINPRFDSW